MKPPQLSNIQTDRFENCLWRQKADVFDRMLGNRKSRSSPCFQRDLGTCSVLVATKTVFFKPNHEVFRSLTKCFLCLHLSVVVECSLHLSAEYLIFLFLSKTKHSVPPGARYNSTLNTYILTFIANMWNNYFIFFLIYASLTHT